MHTVHCSGCLSCHAYSLPCIPPYASPPTTHASAAMHAPHHTYPTLACMPPFRNACPPSLCHAYQPLPHMPSSPHTPHPLLPHMSPSRGQNSWHMLVKTLPFHNYSYRKVNNKSPLATIPFSANAENLLFLKTCLIDLICIIWRQNFHYWKLLENAYWQLENRLCRPMRCCNFFLNR